MYRAHKSAFTLIELLVVVAVISIIAALLFPVSASVRDRARLTACLSNMRQMGAAMTMYIQDYDETYPYIRFHNVGANKGGRDYCWKNAIRPYLKSLDVLGCPSNPNSRTQPGVPGSTPSKPGSNAEGWEVEPEQRMPISYGMNGCAVTWIPADDIQDKPGPPLQEGQVEHPANTILIAENQASPVSDIHAGWLWGRSSLPNSCSAVFSHPAGKVANFIFFDGHARSRKWLATLFPLDQNNWELAAHPDPNNHTLIGPNGCDKGDGTGHDIVPSDPSAKEFQTPACLAYQ